MKVAHPGLGLLPLTPKTWQMDVLQVSVNHENQDNTQMCWECTSQALGLL